MITEYEIWWELPKCDIETWDEQILLGNGTNKFAQHTMNLQFVKRKTASAKYNKVKHNKLRCNFTQMADKHMKISSTLFVYKNCKLT